MKCFYHPDTDAVGFCSQCGKAACRTCIQDVGGAMLCQGCYGLRVKEAKEAEKVEAERAQAEVKRVKRRIIRNWILTGVGALVAAPVLSASFADDPSIHGPMKVLAGAFGAVLGPYLIWGTLWGVPAVWRWWKSLFSKIGCFLVANPFTWLVVIVCTFMIPFTVGYMYGALGGGIYEYSKARKIASGS